MPLHSTIDPIEAAAKAIDALLTAIERATPAAAAAYRAALTRHGRNLRDTAGPEALATVLARIRAEAPDKAAAQDRERTVLTAWEGLTTECAA